MTMTYEQAYDAAYADGRIEAREILSNVGSYDADCYDDCEVTLEVEIKGVRIPVTINICDWFGGAKAFIDELGGIDVITDDSDFSESYIEAYASIYADEHVNDYDWSDDGESE